MSPGPDAAQWYANNIAVWAVVISLLGVFINATIAYLAIGQFRAARAAGEAARESVLEAHKSVELAKNALELGNRAWVHVETIKASVNSGVIDNQNWSVIVSADVVLKNYGSTPATTFLAESRLQVRADLPTTEQLQFQVTDQNGLSVVSPGNSFRLGDSINISIDDWNLVTSGKSRLVLFGRAHYDDIFGQSHKSAWLYWYDSQKVGAFVPGPSHNYVT